MPRFARSALPRARLVVAVLALALSAGSMGIAATTRQGPSPEMVEVAAAGPVYEGLSTQQALAVAFDERLAALRAAARVVPTTQPPAPKPRASRSAPRPRPAPAPKPAPPVVRAAATGPVVWPAAGELTGHYGEPRGGKRHPGIDIDGETGDPVWAATKGVVSYAGPAPSGYSGYGTIVLIDHGDGLQTLYAHLSSLTTTTGAAVEPGVQVGRIGTTGNVTGSHLHFEVRRHGAQTDPLAFLPPR